MNDPSDDDVKSYLASISVNIPSVWASPVEKVTFLSHISIEDTLKVERSRHITMAETLLKPKQRKVKMENSRDISRSRSAAPSKNTDAETKAIKKFSPSMPSDDDTDTKNKGELNQEKEDHDNEGRGGDDDGDSTGESEDSSSDDDDDGDRHKGQVEGGDDSTDDDERVDDEGTPDLGTHFFTIHWSSSLITLFIDANKSRRVTPVPPPPGQVRKRPLRKCSASHFQINLSFV